MVEFFVPKAACKALLNWNLALESNSEFGFDLEVEKIYKIIENKNGKIKIITFSRKRRVWRVSLIFF